MVKALIGKVVRVTIGLLFLLAALVSGFLPGLQGWIFCLIGLAILSVDVPLVRRLLQRFLARFPRMAVVLEKGKARWRARWKRCKGRFARQQPPQIPTEASQSRSQDTTHDVKE